MTLIDLFLWVLGLGAFLIITAIPVVAIIGTYALFRSGDIVEAMIVAWVTVMLTALYLIGLAEFATATGIGPDWIKKPEWMEAP